MKIGIVIVTYNRLRLLKRCVNNALMQGNNDVEIFVVDNASTDGTSDYLKKIESTYTNFEFITMKTNLGGAGGFSMGLQLAYHRSDCDLFLLIDDDAILRENFVTEVNKCISSKYQAYSCSVLVNGKIDTSHRVSKKIGKIPDNMYKDNFECDIATFCGMMVTRDLVKKVGFPRGDFFIWNDDTEYSYRVSKYSKILNITNAIIDHETIILSQDNSLHYDSWKEYYGMRNIIYIYKEYNEKQAEIMKIFRCIGKAILLQIKSYSDPKNAKIYRYNSRLRMDAVKDGIRGKLGKNEQYLPGK